MLTDEKVAGYVANYATRAAENTAPSTAPLHATGAKAAAMTTTPAVTCDGTGARDDVETLPVNPHAKAMIVACWRLGGRLEFVELRLRPWAHMLGFRGHFSTKSRRYSTRLGCLRQARQDWRDRRVIMAPGYTEDARVLRHNDEAEDDNHADEDTILVIGQWHYLGRGYSPGEAIWARTVAEWLSRETGLRSRPP